MAVINLTYSNGYQDKVTAIVVSDGLIMGGKYPPIYDGSTTQFTYYSNFYLYVAVEEGYEIPEVNYDGGYIESTHYEDEIPITQQPNTYRTGKWTAKDRTLNVVIQPVGSTAEPVVRTETETETEPVPFETVENENPDMFIGESQTVQTGVDGVRTITYEVTYTDDVETDRVEISNEITTEPVDEIIEIGTKPEPLPTYTVTYTGNESELTLTNVDDVSETATLTDGDSVTLTEGDYQATATGLNGYTFISVEYGSNRFGIPYKFDISADGATATDDITINEDVDIVAVTELFEPVTYPITYTGVGASVQLTSQSDTSQVYTLNSGDVVNVLAGNYDAVINANEGYDILKVVYGKDDYRRDLEFTMDADLKSGTATIRIGGEYYPPSVDIVATIEQLDDAPEPPEPGEPPFNEPPIFNNLYLMTRQKLYSVSNEFMGKIDKGELVSANVKPYVINLLNLPFQLDGSVIGESEPIKIGLNSLDDITAETLKTDVLTVNLGTISVSEKYGNSYDYLNTDVYLHLPYAPVMTLPPEYVIGESIRVEYVIDLYTGDMTINVYSSKMDDVFHHENVRIGASVPFFHRQSDNTLVQQNTAPIVNNRLFRAYIEIMRNKPYNMGSTYAQNIRKEKNMADVDGFVRVENIELKSDATTEEKTRIKNLLNQGVFINGEN